jgi:hypothetical protein
LISPETGPAGEAATLPGGDPAAVPAEAGAPAEGAEASGAGELATIGAVSGGLSSAAVHPSVARRRANWQRLPGWLFAGVTVLPALLVMAWLIAGLPLLLAGVFADVPMIAISVPLAVALVFFGLRQVPSAWPHGIRDIWDRERLGQAGSGGAAEADRAGEEPIRPESGHPWFTQPGSGPPGFTAGRPWHAEPAAGPGLAEPAAGPGLAQPAAVQQRRDRQRPDVPWWALAGTVAVAAGFAVWQIVMNSQQVIVLRDPGTYLQFAYWIAEHGSTRIPQSLQAFGGAHQGLSFASPGFFQSGTTLVPQYMAGLPMTLAAAVWAGGPLAAAVMAPVIGACAVLAFGGLVGRLAGARWAPAAALVLAVCLPEQYASRSTFSETLAQVVLYGGLCMVVDSFVLTAGRHTISPAGVPSGVRRVIHRSWRDGPPPNVALAFLGGLSIGLTVLIRIDGLNEVLPAIPFLGALLVAKKPQAVPFGIGLLIGVGYGFADGYLLSRSYLDSIGSSLRLLAIIALGALALTVIGMGLMSLARARGLLRTLVSSRPLRWLPEAAAVLTILVLIGFAVRPYLQTVRGETDPATISYVAELQKLAHLPIDGARQYSEDSLYWVIWYIGVPALLLGALGLAVLARRCVRALLNWRDDAAAQVWALPLLIVGWVTVTVLWRPSILPDQPWASRRLVPVVLPGLILAAAWMSAWLKERGRNLGASRLAGSLVAACCVIALLVPPAVTTLGVGLTQTANGSHRPTANGLAFKRTGAGEYDAVRGLCAAIGPNASVVILDSLTANRFSQVIRGMCATPAARMDSPTSASVQAVVAGIVRTGRRPVLLGAEESELATYGAVPREVLNLVTTQDSHELTQPPTTTWPIHFVIWMSQPAALAGGPVARQESEYSHRS